MTASASRPDSDQRRLTLRNWPASRHETAHGPADLSCGRAGCRAMFSDNGPIGRAVYLLTSSMRQRTWPRLPDRVVSAFKAACASSRSATKAHSLRIPRGAAGCRNRTNHRRPSHSQFTPSRLFENSIRNELAAIGVDYVNLRALGTLDDGRAARGTDGRPKAGPFGSARASRSHRPKCANARSCREEAERLYDERDPGGCHRSLLLRAAASDAEIVDLSA